MNYYRGSQGLVKFNAAGLTTSAVAQVTEWKMNIEKAMIDDTRIGDTYGKTVGGLIKGSGSITLVYSASSAATFVEAVNIVGDAGVALFELIISSTDSKRIVFNGLINKASYSGNSGEIATMTCDFVTRGTITLDL
jgi:hypothetical protein